MSDDPGCAEGFAEARAATAAQAGEALMLSLSKHEGRADTVPLEIGA